MRIDQIAIGLLLFGLIFVGGALIIVSFDSNYNLDLDKTILNLTDENNGSAYNMLADIESNITSPSSDRVFGSNSSSVTTVGAEDSLFSAGYRVLKLVGSLFGTFSRLIQKIGRALFIPGFITDILFVVYVLGITFTVVYLIFRFKG